MARHGVAIKDPIEAISAHLSSAPADKAVALADVACKRGTNFVGIATGVQAEVDNSYIAAHLQALTTYTAAVTALVRQAARAGR